MSQPAYVCPFCACTSFREVADKSKKVDVLGLYEDGHHVLEETNLTCNNCGKEFEAHTAWEMGCLCAGKNAEGAHLQPDTLKIATRMIQKLRRLVRIMDGYTKLDQDVISVFDATYLAFGEDRTNTMMSAVTDYVVNFIASLEPPYPERTTRSIFAVQDGIKCQVPQPKGCNALYELIYQVIDMTEMDQFYAFKTTAELWWKYYQKTHVK